MKRAIVVLYILVAALGGWVAYICYRNLQFDADNSAGILVSALGILVSVLVGWQIYKYIDIKKEIEQQQDEIANKLLCLDNENRRLKAKIDKDISRALAIAFSSSAEILASNITKTSTDIFYEFIYNSLMCILNFSAAEDYASCDIRIDLLIIRINIMNIPLSSKDQYARLIKILGYIPNSDKIDKFNSLFETIMSISYKSPESPNPADGPNEPNRD